MFENVGGGEILLILLVILIFFGPKKIPELAQSLGKGIRKFNDAKSGIENQVKTAMKEPLEALTGAKEGFESHLKSIAEPLHAELNITPALTAPAQPVATPQPPVPETLPARRRKGNICICTRELQFTQAHSCGEQEFATTRNCHIRNFPETTYRYYCYTASRIFLLTANSGRGLSAEKPWLHSPNIHRNRKMAQKRYESTFIVKGSLDDKDIDAAVSKAENFISKNGGSVIEMERWGRRKLAYLIGKETQGAYVSAHFTAPGDIVTKLERMYTLDDNVIRFLTIVLPETAVKGRVAMKKRSEELAAKREASIAANDAASSAAAAAAAASVSLS